MRQNAGKVTKPPPSQPIRKDTWYLRDTYVLYADPGRAEPLYVLREMLYGVYKNIIIYIMT